MAGDKETLERELRDSRERLLKAQRVARVGFLDWDLQTNLIVLSEVARELTGFDPDGDVVTPEFVAKTVHPDDLAFVGEQLDLAIKGVQPYDIVHRHLRPDGSVVWVRAQAELTRDERGAPVRLLGTIVDITQQRRSELALRESELKFRTLYETAGDAILLLRQDRFVDCNRRAVQLYGTTRELLIGAPPYRYSPPTQPDGRDSQEKALEKINRALTKGPQFFEWVHCREDRTEFDAEVSLNRLELGGEVLLQAIVRDVSARKRTAAEILRREREYRELMTLANSIILRWTRDGRITFLNEFGQRFFGFSEEEIRGRHVVGTIVPESESTGRDLRPLMDQVCAAPERFARNINENIRRNGERVWIDWTNRVVLDDRGEIREILSIGADITEQRRAERERERYAEQLRELSAHLEAAREEERTKIAREIHDRLGQALTVLKMDLSWIARRASTETGLPCAQLLEKVQGLVQMSDEIIDEVRRISAELRPAILDQVGLGAALAWKAKEIEQHSQLACLVDVSLEADGKLDRELASAIFRVCQEALTNVVRHAGATQVEVRLSESEGSLVLEVRDDGRGITPEEVEDPRSLGLLGIRERVRRLGGTVTFGPAGARGTVVTVRAPLRRG